MAVGSGEIGKVRKEMGMLVVKFAKNPYSRGLTDCRQWDSSIQTLITAKALSFY